MINVLYRVIDTTKIRLSVRCKSITLYIIDIPR